MTEDINDPMLRQFLLGKLDDDVRQRIESLFLTDSAMRERVLAVEQDLVEDYLEDLLATEDKERFILRYARTPAQRRKLRIARSIRDWAVTKSPSAAVASAERGETADESVSGNTSQNPAAPPVTTRSAAWRDFLGKFPLRRPVFVVFVAAVAVVVIVFGIVLFNRWMEQRNQFAIEQELARLNSPASLRESPAGMPIVTLTPVTVRSSDSTPEVTSRSPVPFVELRLPWVGKGSDARFRAVVRRVRDGKTFAIPDLHTDDRDGRVIRLRFPSRLLNRGNYQVQLTTILPDGAAGPTEEYRFTVAE